MKKIIILTGSELRHSFLRKALALQEDITVLASFCEGPEKGLLATARAKPQGSANLELCHAAERAQAEQDFFGPFLHLTPDRSRPRFLPKGAINEPSVVDAIEMQQPDLLVAYGCSIIRSRLLDRFSGRFVNIHLGLSPWYRGSGTNFWPLVNGEPEFIGATFMHIDHGVDTGQIIHQIRARVFPGDDAHRIGNRLITDAVITCATLITSFSTLVPAPQPATPERVRIYRKRDFSDSALLQMKKNFSEGMIDRYLTQFDERCARAPLVCNPALALMG